MLLGIKRYQCVQSDDVQRLTKELKLTAIIQSRRLRLLDVWAVGTWHDRVSQCLKWKVRGEGTVRQLWASKHVVLAPGRFL